MFNPEIFSSRLKNLRLDAGLSQEEVGNIIGIKKSALSDIETGRRATTFEKLCALADYFNVTTDYLLGRTDNPEVNK